jgi:uridine monophosphate synthetase
MDRDTLSQNLFDIESICFGSFTLKSGVQSPIYLDLRRMVSFPALLRGLAELMSQELQTIDYDLLCGVPYTALPFATALSLLEGVPMLMRRKEVKTYGTRRCIEGVFQEGQRCLVIVDLVTSGQSVLETVKPLEESGLIVRDILVVVDREQGGRQYLEQQGYTVHALLSLHNLLDQLEEQGKIGRRTKEEVTNYLDAKRQEEVVHS